MNTTKSVYNRLFAEDKVELGKHEVELGLIDEISKELDAAYKQQDVESELISIMSKMDKAIGMCNIVIQKGEKTLTQIKELGIGGGFDKKVADQIKEAEQLKKSVDFRVSSINKVRK